MYHLKYFGLRESEEAEFYFGVGANSFVNNSMAECSKINCYGLTAGRDPEPMQPSTADALNLALPSLSLPGGTRSPLK